MPLLRLSFLSALTVFSLFAHPMGNFSVNHYTKIDLRAKGPQLTYILDFAEIPTSELFAEWGSGVPTAAALQQSVAHQAGSWAEKLSVTADSHPLHIRWNSVQASTLDGAAGMPVMRVVMLANLNVPAANSLDFHDDNYPNRTGWKEIVIAHVDGVSIQQASQSDRDLSKALTVYPADLTVTPPQDLSAHVTWRTNEIIADATPVPHAVVKTAHQEATAPAALTPTPSPSAKPAPSFATQQPSASGTVQRGDYLSRMLQQKHFGLSAIVIGLFVAFGLGAMHALSPGHGKTIVAAYLVGSRGTLKHAGILGLTVTFTHTISVFLLGIGVLFFQKYIIPEKIVPILGAISGLSIVVIGAYLLYKRSMALAVSTMPAPTDHAPANAHAHSHAHAHAHSHSHAPAPSTFAHTHTHDGLTHTHTVPDNITMGSLLGLGVSGGLVPCPSALILLLSAISLGQVAIGLALLSAFSAGLAAVLIAIGGLVLYGKSLLPKTSGAAQHPLVRLVPVFSSVVVIILGLLMTLTAAGLIQPIKLFS